MSVIVVAARAQEWQDTDAISRSTIFAEIGGASVPVSINYDYQLLPQRLSARVGFMYLPVFSDALVSSPVSISGLYKLPFPGMYLDGSAGITPVLTPAELAIHPTVTLAARIQPAAGGYFLRIGYTWWEPTQLSGRSLGIGIGYTFSGPWG